MSVPPRSASPEAVHIPVATGTDDELYVLGLAGLKHVFALHIESAPVVYSVENAMEWVEWANKGETYLHALTALERAARDVGCQIPVEVESPHATTMAAYFNQVRNQIAALNQLPAVEALMSFNIPVSPAASLRGVERADEAIGWVVRGLDDIRSAVANIPGNAVNTYADLRDEIQLLRRGVEMLRESVEENGADIRDGGGRYHGRGGSEHPYTRRAQQMAPRGRRSNGYAENHAGRQGGNQGRRV